MVHADLKLFLETNLPLSGKKKAMLGVSDAKIGAALQEEFSLSIQTGGVVAEISRGEEGGAGRDAEELEIFAFYETVWPVVMKS